MKPLGEWFRDGNELLVLRCGPLSIEVQQDWKDHRWFVRIPFWVYSNGRRRDDMAEFTKRMSGFGSRDEAMLLAEVDEEVRTHGHPIISSSAGLALAGVEGLGTGDVGPEVDVPATRGRGRPGRPMGSGGRKGRSR